MLEWVSRWHCSNSMKLVGHTFVTTSIGLFFLSVSLFFCRWNYGECIKQKQFVSFIFRGQTKQNTYIQWWQGWDKSEKEPNFAFYCKPFYTSGRFLFMHFIGSNRRRVFAEALKVLKGVCVGIMGISSVWKVSRCASLHCAAGRHITYSVAVPEPVLSTVLLLEELLSSLADTFILVCECSRVVTLPFISRTLELPARRQLPRIGLHNPHITPYTFN